jgi:putative transposase
MSPEGAGRFSGWGSQGVGEQSGQASLSVSLVNVRVMSGWRFGRTPGGVYSLGLHLVGCPKYRRPVLGGRVARRLDELIEAIADGHGWRMVAHEVMPDQVHLLVRVGPTDAPAAVVGAFKGRTARVLGQEIPHPRNFAKVLWWLAYLAASVGDVSETTVRGYVEHQCDAVLAS